MLSLSAQVGSSTSLRGLDADLQRGKKRNPLREVTVESILFQMCCGAILSEYLERVPRFCCGAQTLTFNEALATGSGRPSGRGEPPTYSFGGLGPFPLCAVLV